MKLKHTKERDMEEKNTLKDEPIVQFKMMSDVMALQVKNPDIDEPLAEISGYDLRVSFNFKYLKSLEDVEIASAAIGDLFKQMMLEELLGDRKPNNQVQTITE